MIYDLYRSYMIYIEEELLLAQEEDILLVQEDLLLAQEEDLILVQYMKHESKKYVLQQRSARKFCADSILNHHEMIGNRSSYDKLCF